MLLVVERELLFPSYDFQLVCQSQEHLSPTATWVNISICKAIQRTLVLLYHREQRSLEYTALRGTFLQRERGSDFFQCVLTFNSMKVSQVVVCPCDCHNKKKKDFNSKALGGKMTSLQNFEYIHL